MCFDIIKIWFRIIICPSIIFFPDIFPTITLIHKQIIAMAGYYACGAFICKFTTKWQTVQIQIIASEANWCGSTQFAKAGYIQVQ